MHDSAESALVTDYAIGSRQTLEAALAVGEAYPLICARVVDKFLEELKRHAYSGASRPPIPAQAVHRFRCIPSTHSGQVVHPFRAFRPAILAESVHCGHE